MKQELDITSVGRGERRDVYSQGAPRRSASGGAVDLEVGLSDCPLRSCRVDTRGG